MGSKFSYCSLFLSINPSLNTKFFFLNFQLTWGIEIIIYTSETEHLFRHMLCSFVLQHCPLLDWQEMTVILMFIWFYGWILSNTNFFFNLQLEALQKVSSSSFLTACCSSTLTKRAHVYLTSTCVDHSPRPRLEPALFSCHTFLWSLFIFIIFYYFILLFSLFFKIKDPQLQE